MDTVKGLREYVESAAFRDALEITGGEAVGCSLLARGEYNINYVFTHPVTGRRLVLRVNAGSQMHLRDQIGYEYNALKLLEASGRTPRALYADGSGKHLDCGVMVMEFLEGRELNYHEDMGSAAECLADIHSVPVSGEVRSENIFASGRKKARLINGLAAPENPLQAILDECNEMVQTYYHSAAGDLSRKRQIGRMLDAGQKIADAAAGYDGYRCCVNTELNSGNFLINGESGPNYLVDWEKPLYSDPVQDLGHFLAPTTTFWKSDVILSGNEMDGFISRYEQAVRGRFDTAGIRERLALYIPVTCLRGITWCAMAWIQYQDPDRLIRNEDSFRKMGSYLSSEFLDEIEKRFLYRG